MVAWNNAVIINTAAGYRAFLAQYPDSDLSATARKLEERLRNRPNTASRSRRRCSVPATNASLTCPCNPQPAPAPLKKVDAPAEEGRAGSAEARHATPPKRRVGDEDDVVVVRRPPPPQVYEPSGPPVSIGIGIGLGGGLWRWRYGGGTAAAMTAGVDTEGGNAVILSRKNAARRIDRIGRDTPCDICFALVPCCCWHRHAGLPGVGALGRRSRRDRGFRRSPRSRRQCRQSRPRLGISHRRSRAPARPSVMARTKFQATPLLVEDSLIFCSPFNEVIALDPGTARRNGATIPRSHQPAAGQPLHLPRRRLLGRRPGSRRRRLPRAHLHGHQRRPRDRARCQDRHSLRRFRQQAARSSSISA